ncbi:NUDIX domain-containing protein [Marinomonas sp. C2222]|uniref:NUDIX domain-containing protein n=1 Tax=Marinomonas sargassi TaxID=2984494 RepID=A0ABT2YVH2_9GAMM|nr:NUDIX domain-containing protein [Marinomonas sargassi]MCV2403903.1 NUDIX domain-containing protein [Marinomonas sargassi]
MPDTTEIITLVDKDNNVIGDIPRHEMDFSNHFHRVTYILVLSPKGHLIVQKRADNKAFCPGYFGITTGGVVEKGETYLKSAHRELKEELGIQGKLETHGVFMTQGEGYNIWGKIFTLHYNPALHGTMELQKSEVSSIHEMSIKNIIDNPDGLLFTPDSLDALKYYINQQTQACSHDPA